MGAFWQHLLTKFGSAGADFAFLNMAAILGSILRGLILE